MPGMNGLAAHVRCALVAIARFGVFELNQDTGELRRQGRRVHLAAKPCKALLLLISRSDQLVTREELRQHLWGDQTFVEFDRGLNFTIAEVRAALNDHARSPRFIETVPKRGYRFVADVRIDGADLRVAVHFGHEADAPRAQDAAVAVEHQRREDAAAYARDAVMPQSPTPWTAAIALSIALAAICIQQPVPVLPHTRQTADPIALAQFTRAIQATDDVTSRRQGIAALRAATGIDPRFAEAYYILAEYYWDLALKRELPLATATDDARVAVQRAIRLEDVPESRRLLAIIRLVADWDWPGARREMARAIELEPKWDLGQALYARILSAAGDDDAAIAAINRAEAISPRCDLIQFDAGQIYARAGRYEEALQKFDRAIEYGPPHVTPMSEWLRRVRTEQFMITMIQGRLDDSHSIASSIVALSDVSPDAARRFAADDSAEAIDAFLIRSIELGSTPAPGQVVPATLLAALESVRGHADAALGWLEQAAWEHDPELVWVLRNPAFTRLRALPRFQALDARVRRLVSRG